MWFAMWSSTSASYLDDLTADAQSKKSSKKKAAEECVLKLLHGGVTMGYLNNSEDKMWLIMRDLCICLNCPDLVLFCNCRETGYAPLRSLFSEWHGSFCARLKCQTSPRIH